MKRGSTEQKWKRPKSSNPKTYTDSKTFQLLVKRGGCTKSEQECQRSSKEDRRHFYTAQVGPKKKDTKCKNAKSRSWRQRQNARKASEHRIKQNVEGLMRKILGWKYKLERWAVCNHIQMDYSGRGEKMKYKKTGKRSLGEVNSQPAALRYRRGGSCEGKWSENIRVSEGTGQIQQKKG